MKLHCSGNFAAINYLGDQFALLVRIMPLMAALIVGAVHAAHLVVTTIFPI